MHVRVTELIYTNNLAFLHFHQVLTAPSQVTGLSLFKAERSGKTVLRAAWTTPQSEVPIFQYEVQYKTSGANSWGSQSTISGSPPPTSTILIGLNIGTEYHVRVRAVSAHGAGMWSVVQTERTYGSEFHCFNVTDYRTALLMLNCNLGYIRSGNILVLS